MEMPADLEMYFWMWILVAGAGRKGGGRRQKNRGQTTVEYLLVTMALVVLFAAMFGFLQGQLTKLFRAAGVKILTSYD